MELNPELDNGLEKGKYRLTVDYNYPVLYYGSRKFFVLSTTRYLLSAAMECWNAISSVVINKRYSNRIN